MTRNIIAVAALLAAALAMAATDPATAQITGSLSPSGAVTPAPVLRSSITVASDVVRIGDLLENAGEVANVPIFRSPDVGTTGAVPLRKIIEAARAHNLMTIDSGDIVEVKVTRAGRIIGRKEIEARIARLFANTNGLGAAQDLMVSFDRELPNISADMPPGGDIRVVRATLEPISGRFDVMIEIPVGASRRSVVRFTGALVETAEAVILTRSIGRTEVVRPADVVVERRAKANVPSDAALTVGEVVGRAARQPLRQGMPLRRIDLMKPEIVKRDESVTLVYVVPGMRLTTRGKALESGGEGDLINVLNPQSKRTVQGTVTGPGEVDISTPTSRAVTAAAEASVPVDVPPASTQ